ncbi:MAG: ABC transporter ATP-binding protein [Reyranella sp.]|uniref:ABC transporter ATP-binding protein n=1 Tax=Reyranella sp. TaxID=1929291 RepID=UPI0011F4577C|nr:ABC transporter ATP-binding protein [Reyranella sp.]TAJ97453.1 MAG: ABC transporter ATP-binding protein [Reyranella sp.]TBR28789.1 MAG: ABC transporter ATP-binding protein [Reyranella sp.]
MDMNPVDIAVHDLVVNFGQVRSVLTGVDLAVRRGEFVALIGASGCGKTTLLNVIAGLVPAASGTVTVAGSGPAAGRADICYVLARDALLPWRTVMGNVEYGLELSGVGREERARRAATYIEKVGLSAARDLYPSRLSQGMRQRASLARAFAVDRSLYLMDEPFSALDSQTKLVLHDQLLGLWEKSGATVVFVTHDIGEAITLADRVLVMSKKGTGVVDEIRVDLARPRSAEALQADAHYHDLYRRTWTSLRASAQ